MNLTIGNTSIEITSCARMRDTKRGFYLDIQIPKENIGMEDLYNLLDGCTENIVVTDNTGSVSEYVGFKTLGSFSCEDGVYKVAQICTSEYEAQLSLAQTKIAEQSAIIEAQNGHMASLEEMSMAQLSAIDSILTEVAPAIIDLAVTQAIEAVLATQKETTDGESEVIEE